MLGMVDRHVLELLREDLVSALETRFGTMGPSIRQSIQQLDDFDQLEWLIDRAETEDTFAGFLTQLRADWKG